jgi:hypothetical protein
LIVGVTKVFPVTTSTELADRTWLNPLVSSETTQPAVWSEHRILVDEVESAVQASAVASNCPGPVASVPDVTSPPAETSPPIVTSAVP